MLNPRSSRLDKFFGAALYGKAPLQNVNDVKRFLEAIQGQKDHSACIERLIASPAALEGLHKGLRFNTSAEFINQHLTPFLQYLSDPAVKNLCSGQFLRQLLTLVVEPRTLWNAFLESFKAQKLDLKSVEILAWMLVELLSLPASSEMDVAVDARMVVDNRALFASPSMEIRNLGQKIKHMLQLKPSGSEPSVSGITPGGRHDNDFADFRRIAILPTSDEFLCAEMPFYRCADEVLKTPWEKRIIAHLDNQFRLLREDMLSELREDFQIATGQKKGRRSAFRLRKLSVVDFCCAADNTRSIPCALRIRCESGLETLLSLQPGQRKPFLNSDRSYFKHNSFGCLIRAGEIVAFTTVERNVEALVLDPPVITLRISGDEALGKALLYFRLYRDVEFILVGTPIFAYEPILKCLQEMTDLPLTEEMLFYQQGQQIGESNLISEPVVERLRKAGQGNLQDILRTAKPIKLDQSQLESLVAGLTYRLSLIQGPPGTGKSFVGALLAKAIYDYTDEKILVMCYTNHALDQFLEEFLDIGIAPDAIVRLGSKSTPRTAPLGLFGQRGSFRRSRSTWDVINQLEADSDRLKGALETAFNAYKNFSVNAASILEFLEFEEPDFFEALTVPEQEDGMIMVGKGGHKISRVYLYDRWTRGDNPGEFANSLPQGSHVWKLDKQTRNSYVQRWTSGLLDEQVQNVQTHAAAFDQCQSKLAKVRGEQNLEILRSKRIIGCTTNAAAKYANDLRTASPGVLLLEEAGEILESHVLTALSSQTKQLVLIGDHKQLRPKVNHYTLTVEKGEGYDLNRSLFERLVCSGFPHTMLLKQHRMCPEISTFVRELSYPDLEDDTKTRNRPQPRGLQDRVIFFNHEHRETNFTAVSDKTDQGTKGSKRNEFEVDMVLKIVKYLGQQGYGTDKLVILTPYLGQLHLLRDRLGKENDPVLNDLDSWDLVRAGLLSQASAHLSKRPIRISTIDNYQGEESEIVIATLTRSNPEGDIGFMAAPQRLNVLLSRARDVLIMVGNATTFRTSKKGKEAWAPFINNLNARGHLYDGLPVKCERHPKKTAVLKTKDDFDTECPEGGCPAPCGAKLSCGVHDCPSKCHQISDHSKMPCYKIVKWVCQRSHQSSLPCSRVKGGCRHCDKEDREQEQKRQRDLELEAKRVQRQTEYARKLTEIKDEMDHLRRLERDRLDEEDRARVLQQHQEDLTRLKHAKTTQAERNQNESKSTRSADAMSPGKANQTVPRGKKTQNEFTDIQNKPIYETSQSQDEWDFQKKFLGAQSSEIDTLMGMVGLETVKDKFLSIKSRVDTAVRQGIPATGERFGSVLLGNPGTGKTTVARLYANFLASVGALPGSFFVETTGSKLVNDGVTGCQKTIDNILKNGGGALFVDEAYQLVKGHGGSQVLDFLLPEIENLTGKVVVILAGYQKQMEAFFAHNPGLPSRFPNELKFKDYEDDELLRILEYGIDKKWRGRMKIEGGPRGLYCRIVSRRIGRGRGKDGFGNARAVENMRSRIAERQANRLRGDRKKKGTVDDLLLTKEDLIGPEPAQELENCSAWNKLQAMIGLSDVKRTVQALLDSIQFNFQRELEEKPLVEFTLNKVLLGSPGTGKTTIAKLYGQILADIGMLSSSEMVLRNPSDFIGSVIGESEKNTKGILASTVGKVLVIDEAYGLYGGASDGKSKSTSDPYRAAVVDTIVAEVQSNPGEDRCVLLLGYKEQMEEMLQKVNPGLARRFPLASAFAFEDFTDDELDKILTLKLNQQGFTTTAQGRKVAMEMLGRARNQPHFGNAGEIDILLNTAKVRYQQRISSNKNAIRDSESVFEAQDFDSEFDRGERPETNIRLLFDGVVGCDDIIGQLEGYWETAKNLRLWDMDPREQLPFNFLFRGPPGTGKTSTARKMGKVYYDMGFLQSAEVIEASATDLIGQYVGQTGPKAHELLEKGLGKVLFIDEAYRLKEGTFAKEAMDEIVDCITKPKFAQKLIIILAGYDADINDLMAINPGLTSRFPESVQFNGLSPGHCVELLTQLLQKQKKSLQAKGKGMFDMAVLECPASVFLKHLNERFETLSRSANWAHARDVQALGKVIFGRVIQSAEGLRLTLKECDILFAVDKMVTERAHRRTTLKAEASLLQAFQSAADDTREAAKSTSFNMNIDADQASDDRQPSVDAEGRDVGVADDIWNELQQDKRTAEAAEKAYHELLSEEQNLQQGLEKIQKKPQQNNKPDGDDEAARRYEQARLQHELERRKHEEELEKLRKRREAIEQKRKKEQQAQKKLREMGVCVAGFRWIKQGSGYRCAGGTHFVSDGELGI